MEVLTPNLRIFKRKNGFTGEYNLGGKEFSSGKRIQEKKEKRQKKEEKKRRRKKWKKRGKKKKKKKGQRGKKVKKGGKGIKNNIKRRRNIIILLY